MTPENWPDAFGHSHSTDGYQPLYTATQVREIVRMEVEAVADLIAKTAATHHTTPWGDGYNQAAIDIESGIRARLKEKKDAA